MNKLYLFLPMFATTSSFVQQILYNATTFELKISFNFIDLSMCFVYKKRLASIFLPVITQVINLLNGIERHHFLFNTVGQNSCPLIFDNNHSKFSVICVRFMYKYLALCYFFLFLIRRRLSFLKTFLVYTVTVDHLSPLLIKNSPLQGPFQQAD